MTDDRAPGQPRKVTYAELLALRAEHAASSPEDQQRRLDRGMKWAVDEMARGREMDDAAEVIAAEVARLRKAERRRLTAVEVRCERCTKDGLLLRVVAIPGHIEHWGGWWLAIPSARTQSRFRAAHRARWVLAESETWNLECQAHRGRWNVGWEHLDGQHPLPGLTVVLF